MFIGHFGVGMAAKRVAPRVSLPVLFLAAQFADLLWPILVAGRIEMFSCSTRLRLGRLRGSRRGPAASAEPALPSALPLTVLQRNGTSRT